MFLVFFLFFECGELFIIYCYKQVVGVVVVVNLIVFDMFVDDFVIFEYYVVEYMGGVYVVVFFDYVDVVVVGVYKLFVIVFVCVKVDV